MKPHQALELLREWAGRDLPEMPEIAKKLGCLPLGLKIAGSRLSEMTGKEWLETFKNVSKTKLGRDAKNRDESLEVCLDLSVSLLTEDDKLFYHGLGIFSEDIWIPETAAFKLWQAYEPELSTADCREIARYLHKLALVERRESDGAMLLHDILHNYNHNRLLEHNEYQTAHRKLLNGYNPDEKQAWWELEPDGYIYENLVYHLIELERQNDLHKLLTASPDWIEVKFIHCRGDASSFNDLALALRQYENPIISKDLLKLIQLNTVRQIIMSRNRAFDDEMLRTMALLGRTDEAVNHAHLRTNKNEVFQGLLAVYSEIHKEGPSSYILELISLAKEISSEFLSFNLSLILQLFPETQNDVKESLINELLATSQSSDNELREWILINNIEETSKRDINQALSILETIANPDYKDEALNKIIGIIAKLDWQKAVQLTDLFLSPYDKDLAISNISKIVFSYDTNNALKLTYLIKNKSILSMSLSWFAANLAHTHINKSKKLFDKAIELAKATSEKQTYIERRDSLCQLAMDCCHISTSMAKQFIEEHKTYVWTAEVLKTLAVKLINEDIDEAIHFAHLIKDVRHDSNIEWQLMDFAIEIAKVDSDIALQFVEMIDDTSEQKIALLSVIREISKKDLLKAQQIFKEKVETVTYKTDQDSFDKAIVQLVRQIVKINVDHALPFIDLIRDSSHKDQALTHIIKELAAINPTQAIKQIEAITGDTEKDEAHAYILAEQSKSKPDLLQASLKTIDWSSKDRALIHLVNLLCVFNLDLALETVQHIESPYRSSPNFYKDQAYSAIVEKTAHSNIEMALSLIDKIEDDLYRDSALQSVAAAMSKIDVQKALSLCKLIKYEDHKAYALVVISNHLVESDRAEGDNLLSIALKIVETSIAKQRANNIHIEAELKSYIAPLIAHRNLQKTIEWIKGVWDQGDIYVLNSTIEATARADVDVALSLIASYQTSFILGSQKRKLFDSIMKIAYVLIERNEVLKAFDILNVDDIANYIQFVSSFFDYLPESEHYSPQLRLEIVRSTIEIVNWSHPDFDLPAKMLGYISR